MSVKSALEGSASPVAVECDDTTDYAYGCPAGSRQAFPKAVIHAAHYLLFYLAMVHILFSLLTSVITNVKVSAKIPPGFLRMRCSGARHSLRGSGAAQVCCVAAPRSPRSSPSGVR